MVIPQKYVYRASAFFIGLSILSGYIMSQRTFWGHWPLGLLLGAWLAMSLMVFNRFEKNGNFSLYLKLTASGILLGCSFLTLSPLAFVAFIPLFHHTVQEFSQPEFSWKQAFVKAYHVFILWNIIATYWVANAALVPGLVAFTLNSLFMCIPWLLSVWVGRRFKPLWPIALCCFWLLFEWGHHQWEISWPWLSLGNCMGFLPQWVQWYEYTGTFGGSAWILIGNFIALGSLIAIKRRVWYGLAFLLWIGLPMSISLWMFGCEVEKGLSIDVAIVQPNYEPHFEKFQVDQGIQMKRFMDLSRKVLDDSTEYLLWPETSFEYLESGRFNLDWRIRAVQDLLQDYPSTCLITGLGTIKPMTSNDPKTEATRKNMRGGEPEFFEVQNSAAQVCHRAEDYPLYVKSKLVPGVETFPYRRWLPFLKPIVDQLGGSIYGLGKQSDRTVFQKDSMSIAPVICYESIYGNYIGDYIRKGAQAIFIMTNDGWWDNTPGHIQHLKFGSLRAIEFRKPIARSANTGISCFIDTKGIVHQATRYDEKASVRGKIYTNSIKTFYLKHGDYIIKFALMGAMAVWLFVIWKVLIIRFSKNQ